MMTRMLGHYTGRRPCHKSLDPWQTETSLEARGSILHRPPWPMISSNFVTGGTCPRLLASYSILGRLCAPWKPIYQLMWWPSHSLKDVNGSYQQSAMPAYHTPVLSRGPRAADTLVYPCPVILFDVELQPSIDTGESETLRTG